MKQILVMMAAVVGVMGCGTTKVDPNAPAKLINDPIVEKAVRSDYTLNKPTGELTNADLAKVLRLNLSGWQITDEGLKEVPKLQNLTRLHMFGTYRITDAGLKELAKLQKLEVLILRSSKGRSKFTDAGLKELAKLQKLTTLHLTSSLLTDAGLKELAKLQNLHDLRLDRTQITDAGLKELAKLQKLFHLEFRDTKVTDAGAAELKKALPKCRILGP